MALIALPVHAIPRSSVCNEENPRALVVGVEARFAGCMRAMAGSVPLRLACNLPHFRMGQIKGGQCKAGGVECLLSL
jgi:hypothetical protein